VELISLQVKELLTNLSLLAGAGASNIVETALTPRNVSSFIEEGKLLHFSTYFIHRQCTFSIHIQLFWKIKGRPATMSCTFNEAQT
jgi:hypothetical protein